MVGKSLWHYEHMFVNPMDAISSSVVSDTLTFLCICITLVLGILMVIDASFLDPYDIAEMRVDARSTLVSISPASSAY